jgi:hypothetical protein
MANAIIHVHLDDDSPGTIHLRIIGEHATMRAVIGADDATQFAHELLGAAMTARDANPRNATVRALTITALPPLAAGSNGR